MEKSIFEKSFNFVITQVQFVQIFLINLLFARISMKYSNHILMIFNICTI